MNQAPTKKDEAVAEQMMNITDRIMDEEGGIEAWNNGTSRGVIEDRLVEIAAVSLAQMTKGVIDILEDENFHTTVRAIMRAQEANR